MSLLQFIREDKRGRKRSYKLDLFQLTSLILIPMLLLGCGETQESKGKKIVEAYFESAFAKDFEDLDQLLHDDFLFLGPKVSDTLDKESLIQSWKSTHLRNDILQMNDPKLYDVSDQDSLGENQSLILHYYDARFHNSDLDIWVEFPVHVKFLIFKDKIQQAQIIMNQSDVQTQLGYTIVPPKN